MKLDAEAAEPEEDLSDERMALEAKQAELQCEVDAVTAVRGVVTTAISIEIAHVATAGSVENDAISIEIAASPGRPPNPVPPHKPNGGITTDPQPNPRSKR
ncbi:hypothetical protein ABT337_05090 [Saccharopolyspora hirsuta]|uniref:hypothetical protein n=1 Tax=Saccharopolyspora hirsuta TaxID=1837 RepID=UPI00332B089C